MQFLGIDLGSSSVKLSVFDGIKGKTVASTFYPKQEMTIHSPLTGYAEQSPNEWWDNIKTGMKELSGQVRLSDISAIGISYQMHGLVVVDRDRNVLRPSIIWCDSRAVEIGDRAYHGLGQDYCDRHLLNSPGNFTASKLKWVQENEPEIFGKIHKIMLPGDYVAMKLTGEICTTESGLSEGIFWDFEEGQMSGKLLDHFGIPPGLIPDVVPTFGNQGEVTKEIAGELGLKPGIPVAYRAGDQPNNAFSLGVLEPGEFAATAGTSGVVYGVSDQNISDKEFRVNTFLHVNNTGDQKRNGVLLCINGTGILFSWIRKLLSFSQSTVPYEAMNQKAKDIPIGSDGVQVFPFGNGAERILKNRNFRSNILGIDFNQHSDGHLIRASKEGIVFALNYGFKALKELGLDARLVKAGKSNLFLSTLFLEAFVNTTNSPVELYQTDGGEGAARGAAVGCGFYNSTHEAFDTLECLTRTDPTEMIRTRYEESYLQWEENLRHYYDI